MDCCTPIQRILIVEAPRDSRFSHSSRKSILSANRRSLVIACREGRSSNKFIHRRVPLELSSPEGEFVRSVLQNKPHLFHFEVSKQLVRLASDRDNRVAQITQSSGSSESVLHRRIAELNENNRQTAVEDIMYMSVVQKFSEIEVPMIPNITEYASEVLRPKRRDLEAIHSLEAQEMIRGHLTTILRGDFREVDDKSITTADSVHLAQIYASSVMFGYFLKSACTRHELEVALAGSEGVHRPLVDLFHSEPTKRMKSEEAVHLIKKHTFALLDVKNALSIVMLEGLERMVLEAVSFGSFLWEVERTVDSMYELRNY